MNFKELFDKSIDFIDNNRKHIVTASISILGFILLLIIFFVSSDELNVSKESTHLVNYIEKRQYSKAVEYYEKQEKQFSDSKMKRFNKSISKKINKLLLDGGDKYIGGEITKEYYIGLVNTINALESVDLNLKKVVEQADRVNGMYKEENLTYDVSMSYMIGASSLNGIGDELDVYKQNINVLYESRQVYEDSVKNQQIKKYYEAIEGYNKVLKEDEKYYDLAQKSKKECIEIMYDYYIEKAEESNELGNYEEALTYIEYLKPYYEEDETIQKLEQKYQKNLSMYTLTSEDIINIISKKSGKDKESLSISSFQQMIEGDKYYYVEVFEYDKLVDEVLVDAKTKKIYSYKGPDKDYGANYSDGYFKMLEDGTIKFAISEGEAKFLLENKLKDKDNKYKSIEIIEKSKAYRYIYNKESIDKLIEENKDIYYYALVNKGLFKKKQLYIIDMYTKKIYSSDEEGIKSY